MRGENVSLLFCLPVFGWKTFLDIARVTRTTLKTARITATIRKGVVLTGIPVRPFLDSERVPRKYLGADTCFREDERGFSVRRLATAFLNSERVTRQYLDIDRDFCVN